MHVRVVRFTDVDPQSLEQRFADRDESDGPPPGTSVRKVQILVDAEQGTAVVLQFFDSEADMQSSEQAFDSMDPSDTPGTRASIDRCELKAEFGG